MSKPMYDNFEVNEVAEFSNGDGTTFIEVIFSKSDKMGAVKTFWTVYGHLPTGGVRALMDFNNEKDAAEHLDFFNKLLGDRNEEN